MCECLLNRGFIVKVTGRVQLFPSLKTAVAAERPFSGRVNAFSIPSRIGEIIVSKTHRLYMHV